MVHERLSSYEIGNLNENKKLTARFAKYETFTTHDGLVHISPVLEEGELPELREGYRTNGQQLLISLCNLYLKVKDVKQNIACEHIIDWCVENTNPYYLHGLPMRPYNWRMRNNAEVWGAFVNILGDFSFPYERMMKDLKRLHEDTEILLLFRDIRDGNSIDSRFLNTIRLQEYESLSQLSEMEQLEEMDSLLASLPKFPLELTLDELGDFRIVPAFTNVFESAYYALAQFVATGSEVPLRDGGRTPLQVCASCGKIYYKSGNRQKYCDEIECKKERNRRKANRYAAKQRLKQSDINY